MITDRKRPRKHPVKKPEHKVRRFKMPCIRHIVIHSTTTVPNCTVHDLSNVPYHYVITKRGKVLKFREIESKNTCIEIAYLGGLNRAGKHCDNRTAAQNDGLFRVLVQLTDFFPKATIIGADKIYVYSHANPGFDIKSWLNDYIPEFLQAA